MKTNVPIACRLLAKAGLVVGSQGNASARFFGQMLIKPSGAVCALMTNKAAVAVVDIETGEIFNEGNRPSTDAEAHRHVYRNIAEVGGIVHTHSPWASAWATAGKAIPCCTTAQSDLFGGDVPVSNYCPIGTTDIGEEIVRLHQWDARRRAFLIRQHGVFCIGRDLDEAVNVAILVEQFAHITLMASRLAGLKLIPKEEMDANYERYHTHYGQSRKDPEGDREPPGAGDR